MRISFHGGAREVTGACYLLESEKTKILIDCGIFQGSRECEDLNFEPFRFVPAEIAAVFVTHAHLDHIGRLPRLVREGFGGPIYSTAPTRDLAEIILEDALHLAERNNGQMLYGAADLASTLKIWRNLPYGKAPKIGGIEIALHNAGHILGSAMAECRAEGKRILFTGDLGNDPSVLVPPPAAPRGADYLVIESAYGNRAHEGADERVLQLERTVEDAAARGGTLLIPAFATERTQDILHLLNEMLLFKRIPEMSVFVDSPLAIRATKIYERYPEYYREEIRELLQRHPNLFRFKKLHFTETAEQSKAINGVAGPKIIIAGSGMMQGGRILHHLRRYLGDPKSILLIVGYQAAGSLGRRLVDGEKAVKVFGEEIPVNAEIRAISGFSAHADGPQLFSFVESERDTLKRVFAVQGEAEAVSGLVQQIRDRLGIPADAPELHQEFVLD